MTSPLQAARRLAEEALEDVPRAWRVQRVGVPFQREAALARVALAGIELREAWNDPSLALEPREAIAASRRLDSAISAFDSACAAVEGEK